MHMFNTRNTKKTSVLVVMALCSIMLLGVIVNVSILLNDKMTRQCVVVGTYILETSQNSTGFYGVFALVSSDGIVKQIYTRTTLLTASDNPDSLTIISMYNVSSMHTCYYNRRSTELWLRQHSSTADINEMRARFAVFIFLASVLLSFCAFLSAHIYRQRTLDYHDDPDNFEMGHVSVYSASSVERFITDDEDGEEIIYLDNKLT